MDPSSLISDPDSAPRQGRVLEPVRIREFQNKASELREQIECAINSNKKRNKTSVDASDLRLRSEDEILNVQIPEFEPKNHSSPSKTKKRHHGHVEQKREIIQMYEKALQKCRKEREAEREAAAGILHCLQHTSGEGTVPESSNKSAGRKLSLGDSASCNKNSTMRERVGDDDIVIRLSIHLSQTPSYVSEEWLVLGSTSLCSLRDSIYCVMDENVKNVETEYNNMRLQQGQEPEKIYDASAYFYVEGTFFEDRRHAPEEDLCATIVRYLRENNLKAPLHHTWQQDEESSSRGKYTDSFSIVSMEEKCFADLQVQLGMSSPALFCHQKCCEHLMVFQDVRTHNSVSDPVYKDQYPCRIRAPGVVLEHYRNCEVCLSKTARKVTYNDIRTPHSPFYWCDPCFNRMHYEASGKLIYSDFRVFPYKHDYQSTLMHITK
ncbi:hypothetical protein M9435_002003 [Picochlorum sp. BPE23]|nr:hypothetical protein M9435_002003 [Picochlorum sp. BPE23]